MDNEEMNHSNKSIEQVLAKIDQLEGYLTEHSFITFFQYNKHELAS